MKNKRIRKICFILVISVMSMSAACSSSRQDKDSTRIANQKITSTPTDSPNDIGELREEIVTPAVEPAATKEIYIYTLSADSKDVEARIALVSQENQLTPEMVVDLVTDSLSDDLITVNIDSVTTQEDCIIVSFQPDAAPVVETEKETETAILDALAQSLIENITEDYNKVIFRIAGEAYQTDQYSFLKDQVYLDGTKTN